MKLRHYLIIVLIIALGIFVYFKFYWVFSDGTKAGTLNAFQKKGFMFKTYEGIIIQSGFKANIQSNQFEFSVVDTGVARILLQNSGREVELHYKTYLGALPWRGWQRYIVDSVLEVRMGGGESVIKPK